MPLILPPALPLVTPPQLDSASLHLAVCCRQIQHSAYQPNVFIQQKRGYSHASMCILSLLHDICFADAVFDFMCLARYHSNSIVPGGLLVRSYITRFTPFTSFIIRVITFCNTSNGISEQSAVMKSLVLTARSAIA